VRRASRRLPAVVMLAGLVALLGPAGIAAGGLYTVIQCHDPAPSNLEHEAVPTTFPTPGAYEVRTSCSNAERAIKIDAKHAALQGQHGRATWSAPAATRFVRVELAGRLRREKGHRANVYMASATGASQAVFATGGTEPTTFKPYSWQRPSGHPGYPKLVAELTCVNGNCGYDPATFKARTWVRQVRLTLEDSVAPRVGLRGSLFDQHWARGTRGLEVSGNDQGSGLASLSIRVNGTMLLSESMACDRLSSDPVSRRLVPCPLARDVRANAATTSTPFRDGANSLQVCPKDFSGNPPTCVSRTVMVDNTPPTAAFRNSQLPSDPELIRVHVTDATSGAEFLPGVTRIEYRAVDEEVWQPLPTKLTGDELHARVDSTGAPPGEYEFRALARDAAGNQTVTSTREDGAPMVLRFPLKVASVLTSHLPGGTERLTVPYRRPSKVRGHLLDAHDRPIAGAEVTVVETFDEGALLDRRVRTVSTDAEGRYSSVLPGGPSREVEVLYGGSKRHLPKRSDRLDFNVRSRVGLRLKRARVRAGSRAVFLGKVGRYFARMPIGGKLVEIQVKERRNRWNTLQEARRTDPKGRVVVKHRFRRFYLRPVTFTFRLKATREAKWPYRAPVTSPPRRITVIP
jgi:hypothetical protein